MTKAPSRSIDVARLAGVSRSAVSRAFTEGAYVSPETRDKVLRAAALLDYSPNVVARSLASNSTRIIGIVTTDLQNAFYAHLLDELSRRVQKLGYATLLIVTDPRDSDEGIARLLSYQVDAIIVSAVMLSSKIASRCKEWGKPVVLVDRYIEADNISSVSGDNLQGAADVADLLIDQGYKRLAFMSGFADTSTSRDRELGFRRQVSRRRRRIHAVEIGSYSRQEAEAATRRLLSMSPPPDAIFCANDLMAMTAIDVIRSSSMRVPEDIAVIGYDNSFADVGPPYEMSSVDQNVASMAEFTVDEDV